MPGGRPLELDHTLRTRRSDGTPVTVSEHLLERITLGVNLSDAAASANVTRQTLHSWRRAGANARAREATKGEQLTPKEARLVEFLDALERAEADAEATRLGMIHRAAAGGAEVKKVTRRYERVKVDGTWVEIEMARTEVTETLRPEWTASAWILERRWPQRYARTVRTEVSGPGGGPVQLSTEERAERMADDIRAYLQGVEDSDAGTPALPPAAD